MSTKYEKALRHWTSRGSDLFSSIAFAMARKPKRSSDPRFKVESSFRLHCPKGKSELAIRLARGDEMTRITTEFFAMRMTDCIPVDRPGSALSSSIGKLIAELSKSKGIIFETGGFTVAESVAWREMRFEGLGAASDHERWVDALKRINADGEDAADQYRHAIDTTCTIAIEEDTYKPVRDFAKKQKWYPTMQARLAAALGAIIANGD